MSTLFVPQTVVVSDDTGQMSKEWYGYFLDAYQQSGLAGVQNPLWEMVSIQSGAVVVDDTNPPTKALIDSPVYGWSFVDADTCTAHATIVFPDSYVDGSNWHPYVQWMPSNTNTSNVTWDIDYRALHLDTAPVALAQISLTDAGQGTAKMNHYIEGDAVIGADYKSGSVLSCSITRNGSTDTFSGDAFLLHFGIKCMRGGIGSINR